MQGQPNIAPQSLGDGFWLVPCQRLLETNEFIPLCAPFSLEVDLSPLQSRLSWVSYEDEALKAIVQATELGNWVETARALNAKVHRGLCIRKPKQCRERYSEHLAPSLRFGNWSCAEELLILQGYKEFGSKWVKIARHLHGRSGNQVKSRFRSLMNSAGIEASRETQQFAELLELKKEEAAEERMRQYFPCLPLERRGPEQDVAESDPEDLYTMDLIN